MRFRVLLFASVALASGVVAIPSSASAASAPEIESAAAPVVTANAATRRPAQVFLLSSSPDSLSDLRKHAGSVGAVYPTFFDCREHTGALTGSPIAGVDEYAHLRGLPLMPRFNCQNGATVHRILTEPSLRAATLRKLIAIGSSAGFRGICLDLENDGAADRQAMSSFVAQLAGELHARHRRLAVVVVGVTHEDARASTGFYDDAALGAAADNVFAMAWGTHWEHSAPGPISTLAYVREVASYISSLPSASKFVLGAPMYGLDWTVTDSPEEEATAYQYADIAALAKRVKAHPRRDAASEEMTFEYHDPYGRHVVWYMDAHAVAAILRIGREAGLGVGLWRLGREDQRIWYSPLMGS